jgi:hypothetical protein
MPVESERPKFIADLLAEVDAFDAELFKPTNPVRSEDEDVVIGEMSPWCRKAYAMVRHLNRQGKMLVAERELDSLETISQDAEVCELRYKANLMNEMLFAVVRSEYNAFNTSSIGIREGWKVVSTSPDDEDDNPVAAFMAMMKRMKNG